MPANTLEIIETTPPLSLSLDPGLRERMAARQQRLQAAAHALKQELFGLDALIDRLIDAIRAWYVLPELIERPVIVCLWGLTGTGKTQLARRLAQLLGKWQGLSRTKLG